MSPVIGSKALIPNPALEPLEFLVGEWQTIGSHPYVPDVVLNGHTSFSWHEGGAFLIMRSEIDHPQFPDGVAIFVSDDGAKRFYMLYFDERSVSRKYDVILKGSQLKWQREDPDLSQRSTITIGTDGNTLFSQGEMSRNSRGWEKDLSLTYIRQ